MVKFYKNKNGNAIIALAEEEHDAKLSLCENWEELIPNTLNASREKHIPILKIENDKIIVNVGEVVHPMEEKHYIKWIALSTNKGNQRKFLKPGEKPTACFYIDKDEDLQSVYAYCNIHQLWENEK